MTAANGWREWLFSRKTKYQAFSIALKMILCCLMVHSFWKQQNRTSLWNFILSVAECKGLAVFVDVMVVMFLGPSSYPFSPFLPSPFPKVCVRVFPCCISQGTGLNLSINCWLFNKVFRLPCLPIVVASLENMTNSLSLWQDKTLSQKGFHLAYYFDWWIKIIIMWKSIWELMP